MAMNICSLLVKYSPLKMLTQKESKHFTINKKLLQIKAHYFFFYGGIGGIVEFLPLLVKDLGFHATAAGVIYTLITSFNFLATFTFGYITDFFRNIKFIMITLAVVITTSAMLILLVPSLETETSPMHVTARCSNNSDQLNIKSLDLNSTCLSRDQEVTQCSLTSRACFTNRSSISMVGGLTEIVTNHSTFLHNETHANNICIFSFDESDNSWSQNECACLERNYSYLKCSPRASFSEYKDDPSSVYITFNFWLLLILLIMTRCGSVAFGCISDASCYEVLDEQSMLFGRQRLWGTVSWGIVTLVTGYLNDIATGDSFRTNYSPGFYIMLAFMTIDLVILYKLHVVKAKMSMNIFKDVRKIFSSYKTIAFAITAYICGAFNGLLWNYQFWYLQDLGASQTLLGLVGTVQSVVIEVPFFFFSGWLIKKFGHFNCLLVALMAFALRMGLYSVLRNPWLALPIELLNGITFAVVFSTVTDFAAKNAFPGTEATTLGVLEGVYEGLGIATGSLLGGLGFDYIGGRMTFFSASMFSLICVPFLAIVCIFLKRTSEDCQTESIHSTDQNN